MPDSDPDWRKLTAENFDRIADTLDEDLRPHVDDEGLETLDSLVERDARGARLLSTDGGAR